MAGGRPGIMVISNLRRLFTVKVIVNLLVSAMVTEWGAMTIIN